MKKPNLDTLDKLALIALFIFSLLFINSLNAQEKRIGLGTDNENIYGTWQSWDGSSVLYMNYSDDGDTFYRR